LGYDELEEFRNLNVDCVSGDVAFINDLGETMDEEQTPVGTSKDMAENGHNETEVR